MKLSRKDLKSLIENFLFEEEDKGTESQPESSSDLEQKLIDMAKDFKNFKIPASSAYKFSIVKEDGGLCLTIANTLGAEEEIHLSFREMALSKEEGLQNSHRKFIETASTILGGVDDEEVRNRIHDAISPFVGDFKDKIYSRKYLVQFNSTYGQHDDGPKDLAMLS